MSHVQQLIPVSTNILEKVNVTSDFIESTKFLSIKVHML